MATAQHLSVVAVFDTRYGAQQAVNELRRVGFREDQIGVLARHGDAVTGENAPTHAEIRMTDEGDDEAIETYVEEGAVTGVAAGAGVGALWAVGIAAGLIPAIGPVVAGGTLAAILASAAAGATAGGLVGALIGSGVPEDEAHHYETRLMAGGAIVTVEPNGRFEEASNILSRYGGHDVSDALGDEAYPSTSSGQAFRQTGQARDAASEAGTLRMGTTMGPMGTGGSTGLPGPGTDPSRTL